MISRDADFRLVCEHEKVINSWPTYLQLLFLVPPLATRFTFTQIVPQSQRLPALVILVSPSTFLNWQLYEL